MCKSIADGGQRCAAHTRGPFGKHPIGTPQWEKAATNYATTTEGKAVLETLIDQAIRHNNPEHEALLRTALKQANTRKQANTETKNTITNHHNTPPPHSGYPTPQELTEPFSSPTTRRGLINRMYWDNLQQQTTTLFHNLNIPPHQHQTWQLTLTKNPTTNKWEPHNNTILHRGNTGPWHTTDHTKTNTQPLQRALNDLIPTRTNHNHLLITATYTPKQDIQLKMQHINWAL